MKKIISLCVCFSSTMLWAGVEEDFTALLKRVEAQVPRELQNYRPAVTINGREEPAVNIARRSTVEADLAKKTARVVVYNPARKEGVERVETVLYLLNSQVLVEQKFIGESFGDFVTPVTLTGDILRANQKDFRYLNDSPANAEKRARSATHNIAYRAEGEAHLKVTPKVGNTEGTELKFEFGLDIPNKGVYYLREATQLATGEKDHETGADEVLNIRSKISLTEKAVAGGIEE